MHSAMPRLTGAAIIVLLFVFGVVSTIVIQANEWDIEWAALFFTPGGEHGGWTQARSKPWDLFYDYGEIPAGAIVLLAATLYAAVLLRKAPRKYAKPCLVVILTVALGPGLLVNGILKPYWGRPRPVDVTFFGGASQHRNVWPPGGPGQGRSFTCGHCAMAFSVTSLGAFYQVHPMLAVLGLSGGIVYGTAVSAGRVVQGGHFPTDAIWSGVLMLSLVAALYFLVLRIPETNDP